MGNYRVKDCKEGARVHVKETVGVVAFAIEAHLIMLAAGKLRQSVSPQFANFGTNDGKASSEEGADVCGFRVRLGQQCTR